MKADEDKGFSAQTPRTLNSRWLPSIVHLIQDMVSIPLVSQDKFNNNN